MSTKRRRQRIQKTKRMLNDNRLKIEQVKRLLERGLTEWQRRVDEELFGTTAGLTDSPADAVGLSQSDGQITDAQLPRISVQGGMEIHLPDDPGSGEERS